MMDFVELTTCRLAYRLYGNRSNVCIVVETALAASCAEWWHLAEKWSSQYFVLLYDRAGYGLSDESRLDRSPENIAKELNDLLNALDINSVILIGHSIGGLYSYQFSKLFPEKVISLTLLDPVSPNSSRFKNELTKQEFKKSGIDKSFNLKIGYLICLLGLGSLFKRLFKKAPPFYYYNEFSIEAQDYILRNLTSRIMYKTALMEYACIEDSKTMSNLNVVSGIAQFPVYLICHTSEVVKSEIEYFGHTDSRVSEKIENMWLDMMKEYLKLSLKSKFMQAKNSGHFIHLSEPEVIWHALQSISSVINARSLD